jgi:Protein of unknown function (DUF2490)
MIPTSDPNNCKDRDAEVKIRSSRWRHRLPVEVMLAVAAALFPEALFCQAAQQLPRQDFQAWAGLEASHPLGESTDFLLSTGLRYSNDQGHLVYRRITTGFAFRWRKYFTFEPYYQFSVSDSFSGRLTHENRLAFATTVGAPWKRWHISDRNLVERRFEENQRWWRYRNRVEVRRPIVVARKQLSVFAWDEVYYGSDVRRWYRNRLALGAERRLSRKMSIAIFYIHQNDGYSRPGDLNGLGMTIKTRF